MVPSYALAFGYCACDAIAAGRRVWSPAPGRGTGGCTAESASRETLAAAASFDALLWQSLASVAIPGATINAIVRASRFAVARSPLALSSAVSKWLPTAAGLCSVPLIIHPIDGAVDWGMDRTTRAWMSDVL